jgi:hypothetical protein
VTIVISTVASLNLQFSSKWSLLDYYQDDYDLAEIPELVYVVSGFARGRNAD